MVPISLLNLSRSDLSRRSLAKVFARANHALDGNRSNQRGDGLLMSSKQTRLPLLSAPSAGQPAGAATR